MEYYNEPKDELKQRHGCVTAWLILMIIANSFTAISYLVFKNLTSQTFPEGISEPMILTLSLISIGNIFFAVLLFKWRRIGFWGISATAIVTLFINLSLGISVGQSLLGLMGIAILYGVLQIKVDDVSAWENLE